MPGPSLTPVRPPDNTRDAITPAARTTDPLPDGPQLHATRERMARI
jgi:hypothetical protein